MRTPTILSQELSKQAKIVPAMYELNFVKTFLIPDNMLDLLAVAYFCLVLTNKAMEKSSTPEYKWLKQVLNGNGRNAVSIFRVY